MVAIPTTEPTTFRRGETVKWTKSFAGYAPADWTLTYYIVTQKDRKQVIATDNGDGSFLVTIAKADSAQFMCGGWKYQAVVDDGSEAFVVGEGAITVAEGFSEITNGHETRSAAARILAELETLIENTAGDRGTSLSVDGYSASYETKADLIQAHSHFKRLVKQEQAAESLSSGIGRPASVRIRF